METALHSFQDSIFISANTDQLIRRFSLSYQHEFTCIDYYVDTSMITPSVDVTKTFKSK